MIVFLEAFGAEEAVCTETIVLHLKWCVQLYSPRGGAGTGDTPSRV